MNPDPYKSIIEHYENCLRQFGDTHKGVDWPNEVDAETRYRVMLNVITGNTTDENVSVLDFGCGTAALLEFINRNSIWNVDYFGLDISDKFIDVCKSKFPENSFYCIDILKNSDSIPEFDFILMNGVFTEKRDLSFEVMLDYFKQVIKMTFNKAKRGIAFNVMSKHVDWERPDLFHLPYDILASFLTKELSRHFVIRNDYGLYEYTVYLYKKPNL